MCMRGCCHTTYKHYQEQTLLLQYHQCTITSMHMVQRMIFYHTSLYKCQLSECTIESIAWQTWEPKFSLFDPIWHYITQVISDIIANYNYTSNFHGVMLFTMHYGPHKYSFSMNPFGKRKMEMVWISFTKIH